MEPQPDRITREIELLGRKREAAEAAGEELTVFEADDAPLEVLEPFWEGVVEFEQAPWTTHYEELAHDGVDLVPPEQLDDAQLPAALRTLIGAMAARRTYLHHTNHLNDRELYAWLWSEGLAEQCKALPKKSRWNRNLDPLGSGSDEDTLGYLRYFADEAHRASWLKSFPTYALPPHEAPPYDRDRFLPQPDYSLPDDLDLEL